MSETIVLIHGYAFDYRIWYPVELAFEGYHTQYLSLPGFGEDAVEEPYTIEQLAQRFWAEIDHKISPKVHLVGHSMGGYVCLEMVAQHPERVASLALIHSHVFADSAEKKVARDATVEDIQTNGRAGFVSKMISSLVADSGREKEIVDKLILRGVKYDDRAWIYGTMAIRDRKDHSETLKNIRFPVLMIMGEKDKAVPPELAYSQAHLAEQTTFHMYPEVGHLSMYENTAQMINDLVVFYTSHKG
jgi:pimeloyl-ACP methyl ester carboxylesterase